MTPCRKTAFLVALVVLAACGSDDGHNGYTGGDGPAQVTTVAYVLSECTEGPTQGFTLDQKLVVRHGDADPVTVVEVPTLGPLPGTEQPGTEFAMCRWWGANVVVGLRVAGLNSVVFGAFQRVGVSPDGSLVVFEVTDDFSEVSKEQVPHEQEGIFVVRPDGSGLRRIGPASRAPSFRVNLPFVASQPDSDFSFDADGLRITFPDIGMGPDGEAGQIFTMNVTTGERYQVTRLPPALEVPLNTIPVRGPSFLQQDTIAFASWANPVIDGEESNPLNKRRIFTVKTDDPGKLRVVPVVAQGTEAATIIDAFQITGPEPRARSIGKDGRNHPFVLDGERVLQLTNFPGTGTNMSADGQQVFFQTRSDPLGTNPCYEGNIFSTDRNGGDLRQLTGRIEGECDQPRDCPIATGKLNPDPVTQSLAFASPCDLVGLNPDGGDQIFAMHPDGSGLRQLTRARGVRRDRDGTISVEKVGPWNSAALPR
jgi:hypothetical protein